MAKRLLPFSFYPSHWGLKGKAKELALIDFHFEGLEADLKRAEITCLTKYDLQKTQNELQFKHGMFDEFSFEDNKIKIDSEHHVIPPGEVALRRLNFELQYNKIDQQAYDKEFIELIKDEDKKYLAALDYALKYKGITQNEYDKEVATFNKEPWFAFDVEFDEEANDIIMSFDYNEYFWKKLRSEGHPGNDEHEIIDNFIRDWGRKLATEDYSGDYDTKLTSLNDEMNQTTGSTDFKIYE